MDKESKINVIGIGGDPGTILGSEIETQLKLLIVMMLKMQMIDLQSLMMKKQQLPNPLNFNSENSGIKPSLCLSGNPMMKKIFFKLQEIF